MLRTRENKFFMISGWSILLLGIFLTSVATYYVHTISKKEDQMRFKAETEDIIRRILVRFERYENSLIQARAFFLSSRKISRSELRRYFEHTELLVRYPGLMGLGFSQKIMPHELSAHEKRISHEIPQYKVWPQSKRDVYHSIVYLEPMTS